MTVSPEQIEKYMREAETLFHKRQLTDHFPVWVETLHPPMIAEHQLAMVIDPQAEPDHIRSNPGDYIQTRSTDYDSFGKSL